jgi:hypothetical protein
MGESGGYSWKKMVTVIPLVKSLKFNVHFHLWYAISLDVAGCMLFFAPRRTDRYPFCRASLKFPGALLDHLRTMQSKAK